MDEDVTSMRVAGRHSAAKAAQAKFRGVVLRPLSASISRAQDRHKLYITDADDIDINLYGRFLGLLKDAGIPWKASRLQDDKVDAMHTMNALVLSVNAYHDYQNDVHAASQALEAGMQQSRMLLDSQASEIARQQAELEQLHKERVLWEKGTVKGTRTLRDALTSTKARLTQSERELNDANIQGRKLELALQEERRLSEALTRQLLEAKNPRFSKGTGPQPSPRCSTASFGSTALQRGPVGSARPSGAATTMPLAGATCEQSAPTSKIPAAPPGSSTSMRSPLPWLDAAEGVAAPCTPDRVLVHANVLDQPLASETDKSVAGGAATSPLPLRSRSIVSKLSFKAQSGLSANLGGSSIGDVPSENSEKKKKKKKKGVWNKLNKLMMGMKKQAVVEVVAAK